ncbi:Os03g0170000, partial [Oryza sativa Japonica Group]
GKFGLRPKRTLPIFGQRYNLAWPIFDKAKLCLVKGQN